jgi:hypothetical protein
MNQAAEQAAGLVQVAREAAGLVLHAERAHPAMIDSQPADSPNTGCRHAAAWSVFPASPEAAAA